MIGKANTAVLCLYLASASMNIQRSGWLDRVVSYQKNKFIQDVAKLPPVEIRATIGDAPPGYVDSDKWNFDSVIRLLTLLRKSESGRAVHRALRRALHPTRRLMMGWAESYKYFPSLNQDNYYESDSDSISFEDMFDSTPPRGVITDNSIVIVANPVEARLPSARISVKMLRQIMEARAVAGRIMPSTMKPTIPWIPMNKSSTADGGGDDGGGGNSTTGGDGDGNGTTPADGDTSAGGGDGGGNPTEENTGEGGDETEDPTEAPAERFRKGGLHILNKFARMGRKRNKHPRKRVARLGKKPIKRKMMKHTRPRTVKRRLWQG